MMTAAIAMSSAVPNVHLEELFARGQRVSFPHDCTARWAVVYWLQFCLEGDGPAEFEAQYL